MTNLACKSIERDRQRFAAAQKVLWNEWANNISNKGPGPLQIQHSSSTNDLVSQQEVKMSGGVLRLEYYFVYEGRVGGGGGGIW